MDFICSDVASYEMNLTRTKISSMIPYRVGYKDTGFRRKKRRNFDTRSGKGNKICMWKNIMDIDSMEFNNVRLWFREELVDYFALYAPSFLGTWGPRNTAKRCSISQNANQAASTFHLAQPREGEIHLHHGDRLCGSLHSFVLTEYPLIFLLDH